MDKKINLIIAIPTLNSEKTITIPMESILNQKKHGFNLKTVIVDSGSVDKTKEIFLSYGNKLDLHFNNVGKCSIGEARNYVIKFYESDFLIFLDSDDALISDRLLFDYKKILNNQKLNFIYGDSLQINKDSYDDSYYCKSTKEAGKYQFLNIPYNLSSITISRDFLIKKRINFKTGKEGRLGEDWRFINDINNVGNNYLYTDYPKVIINSRLDSHTQDYLKSDLNISKMQIICSSFLKIRDKKSLIKCLFFSSQIFSSLILSMINIYKYTYPKNVKNFISNIRQIFKIYYKISLNYALINIFLIPISIYLIIFVHRRSIFSPLRSKISLDEYKFYSLYL